MTNLSLLTDTDIVAHAIRAWLDIPYATAKRFDRPVLLPFNQEHPTLRMQCAVHLLTETGRPLEPVAS
jgi:carboxylesterase type B